MINKVKDYATYVFRTVDDSNAPMGARIAAFVAGFAFIFICFITIIFTAGFFAFATYHTYGAALIVPALFGIGYSIYSYLKKD